MLATVLSVLGAVCYSLFSGVAGPGFAAPYFLTAALLLLGTGLLATALLWQPLVRTEQKTIACAQELFVKDYWLKACLGALFAFTLFSFSAFIVPSSALWTICWIVLFGVSFDLLTWYLKRLSSYTQYPFLINRLNHELRRAIRNEEEAKGIQWLSVAIDSAAKAVDERQVALGSKAFLTIHELVETYVTEVARLEALAPPEPASMMPSFSDKVNYICIYTCERLQWVFESALRENMQPVAEEVISTLGKLAVFFARHNVRVAAIPFAFIADCMKIAQAETREDLLIRASLTLSETCKALFILSKEKNESYRDPLLSAFLTMETTVKSLHKLNKEINPALLMQPFAEIGQFLAQDPMKTVLDREEILREIRRVFAEFQSLQLVMQNLEEVAAIPEDTTASFSQDVPYMP